MPRIVELTVAPSDTERLLGDLRQAEGIVSIRLQRGASVSPPGDAISITITNRGLHPLLAALQARSGGQHQGTVVTSGPLSVVAPGRSDAISSDTSEATWEEMEQEVARESNMTANGLSVMLLSGVIAAVGLSSNTLHFVIAAMVIAPGFEPLTRISLGAIGGSPSVVRRGLVQTCTGYLALMLGAALAILLMRLVGKSPPGAESSYLPPMQLLTYWSSIEGSSIIVSVAASVGGAVLIAANRAVLTAGVMLGLALIPSSAMIGVAGASLDLTMGLSGLLRWAIDAALVVGSSAVVFAWKRHRTHRRAMLS